MGLSMCLCGILSLTHMARPWEREEKQPLGFKASVSWLGMAGKCGEKRELSAQIQPGTTHLFEIGTRSADGVRAASTRTCLRFLCTGGSRKAKVQPGSGVRLEGLREVSKSQCTPTREHHASPGSFSLKTPLFFFFSIMTCTPKKTPSLQPRRSSQREPEAAEGVMPPRPKTSTFGGDAQGRRAAYSNYSASRLPQIAHTNPPNPNQLQHKEQMKTI